MTSTNEKQKLLLLGFGDIAKRLASHLQKKGFGDYEITGIRRSVDSYAGVRVRQVDASDNAAMLAVTRENFDVIVITMTPDEMSDSGYQRAYVEPVQTLITALQKNTLSPQLIIFVSSSSVYGQHNNEWVNECSETCPTSFSGRRLLEAEKLLMNSPYTSSIVRFSGIYGVGRQRLIEQVRVGNVAKKVPVTYSNRIHSDDCAGVIAHIMARHKQAQNIDTLYLATDCQPSALADVKHWLGVQLGLVSDHFTSESIDVGSVNSNTVDSNTVDFNAEDSKPVSFKIGAKTLRGGKRCSNERLLASGYQFLYPTFKEGYKMVLDNLK
jgi:nucleoside-diphosphate-sugar epimerase